MLLWLFPRENDLHLTEMLYTTFQNGAKENLCIA